MASLMEQKRAQAGAPQAPQDQAASGGFQAPDWRQFTPPDVLDDVERIVAAGAKLMYSPEMREELQEAISADLPVPEKLADNVVGLTLTMDQQAQGGLPAAALFPAALGLLAEAAEVLQAAGQPVSQEDFNDAALRAFVIIGKKLGGTDEDIMKTAQQWDQGGEGEMAEQSAGQPAPAGPAPGGPAPAGAAAEPMPEEDEEAAMARGMQ